MFKKDIIMKRFGYKYDYCKYSKIIKNCSEIPGVCGTNQQDDIIKSNYTYEVIRTKGSYFLNFLLFFITYLLFDELFGYDFFIFFIHYFKDVNSF